MKNTMSSGPEVVPLTDKREEVREKEIERKFLVKELPADLESYPHQEIMQGYLAIANNGTEVRLRRKGDAYYQTVKAGRGEVRMEREIRLQPEQFEALWDVTAGWRVEKTRYEIREDENLVELDIYHGILTGLITAEVEFKNEKASREFRAPAWFGREVTDDPTYKNQSLATEGLPRT